jgi:hypothetical protein
MSEYTRLPEYDEDWGEAFIRAMRAHMEQLYASLDVEDPDDPAADPVVLSGQPFCGCEDCDERERYTLATILIIEGYEAGKVKLVDVE